MTLFPWGPWGCVTPKCDLCEVGDGLSGHRLSAYFLYHSVPASPAAPPPTNFCRLLTCPRSWLDTGSLRVNKWSFVFPNRPEALHSPVAVIHHSLCSTMYSAWQPVIGAGGGIHDDTMNRGSSVLKPARTWAVLLRCPWQERFSPTGHVNLSGATLGAKPTGGWNCSHAQGRASGLTCIWAVWPLSPQTLCHQLFLTQNSPETELSGREADCNCLRARDAGVSERTAIILLLCPPPGLPVLESVPLGRGSRRLGLDPPLCREISRQQPWGWCWRGQAEDIPSTGHPTSCRVHCT